MSNQIKIILVIIFILLIVALEVIVCKSTNNIIDDAQNKIISLQEALLSKDYEKTKEESKKLSDEWEKNQEKFLYFMHHEEIEQISVKIAAISENSENKAYESALEDSTEAKFLLEHLKDKLKLTLNNVF